jgi:hypothetical protein
MAARAVRVVTQALGRNADDSIAMLADDLSGRH